MAYCPLKNGAKTVGNLAPKHLEKLRQNNRINSAITIGKIAPK
jgi:hypothetical protein